MRQRFPEFSTKRSTSVVFRGMDRDPTSQLANEQALKAPPPIQEAELLLFLCETPPFFAAPIKAWRLKDVGAEMTSFYHVKESTWRVSDVDRRGSDVVVLHKLYNRRARFTRSGKVRGQVGRCAISAAKRGVNLSHRHRVRRKAPTGKENLFRKKNKRTQKIRW